MIRIRRELEKELIRSNRWLIKFEEAKGEMGEKDFESEAMFERNIR